MRPKEGIPKVEAEFPFTPLHRALMHNYGYHPRRVSGDDRDPVIHVVDFDDRLRAVVTRSKSDDEPGWVIAVPGRPPAIVPLDTPGWTIADVMVEAIESPD